MTLLFPVWTSPLENRSDSDLKRPISALRSAFRNLNGQINEIESCKTKAEAARGSGNSDRDVERSMHSLIIGEECVCNEESSCSFPLKDTWLLLRNHDKWKGLELRSTSESKKRKQDSDIARPIGNKLAKSAVAEKAEETRVKDKRLKDIGDALDKKNTILRQSYYLSLFSNPALDPEISQTGLNALAKQAIAELNDKASDENEITSDDDDQYIQREPL
jgi:hypothetical protein